MAWDWDKWKEIGTDLAKVGLPLLGTALGGPAGGAAGALVAGLLGKSPDELQPGDLLTGIQNPEILVKLKEIESNHELELQRIILRGEELRLADLADARKMHVETTKATGRRDYNLYVFAWLFVIGFFVVMVVVLYLAFSGKGFSEMNSNAVLLVGVLITALTARLETITSFFYGSSSGSKGKDKTLDRLMSALAGKGDGGIPKIPVT